MKLGIQAGSVGDGTLSGAIAYCKSMEIPSVVLTAGAVPGYTKSGLIDVRALEDQVAAVSKAGLSTDTMQFWPPFSLADEAATKDTLSKLGKNMDAVAKAGIRVLSMFTNLAKPVNPADEEAQWAQIIDFYGEITSQAEKHGIVLASHYSGHTGRSLLAGATGYRKLFAAVPSASNGLTWCVGNVWVSDGQRLYDVMREFAPRIFFVHMRSTKTSWGEAPFWWDIADGPDLRRIFQILKEIGYEGTVSSEHMPEIPDENRGEIGNAWANGYMRAILRYL
ncbi:MAG: TIM barrel protein [Chloroflexi bacterium]|nr:TIM barrel protein [Chloroflexota bacterium]